MAFIKVTSGIDKVLIQVEHISSVKECREGVKIYLMDRGKFLVQETFSKIEDKINKALIPKSDPVIGELFDIPGTIETVDPVEEGPKDNPIKHMTFQELKDKKLIPNRAINAIGYHFSKAKGTSAWEMSFAKIEPIDIKEMRQLKNLGELSARDLEAFCKKHDIRYVYGKE